MKLYTTDNSEDAIFLRYKELIKTDNPVFQFIEKKVYKFIDDSNPANELHEKFFSDDAIYSIKYSVIACIDYILFEVMPEYKLKVIDLNDSRIDYAAILQD